MQIKTFARRCGHLMAFTCVLHLTPWAGAEEMVEIVEEIATRTATASSEFAATQRAANMVNGSGLSGGRHENDGSSKNMWHTTVNPVASSPGAGLPSFPAWSRFDFDAPSQVEELEIWNHNQAGFTNRGFRKTKIYGTADGVNWKPLAQAELKQGGDTSQIVALGAPGTSSAVKSIIIAAESNWGGNVYGLSEVKFCTRKRVAEESAPFPTNLACQPQPYYRHRKDGKAGREVAVKFSGAKLYGAAKAEVTVTGGPAESIPLDAVRGGIGEVRLLLPPGVAVDKASQVSVTISRGGKSISKQLEVPAKRQWTVFVYPHSHVDIGYTQPQDIVAKISVRNLNIGMEVAESSRKLPAGARYVWNPEVTWAVENFLKVATPDEKQRFVKAVDAGEVGLDASYGHLNTSVCSDEELFHYFDYGYRLRRMTKAPVDTMVQVDVPGITWGLGTVAAQAGIKGVIDFPNGFDRRGTINSHFERPFWWVSPDGKSRFLYIQGPRYDLGWVWKISEGKYAPNPCPRPEVPSAYWVQDWPSAVDRIKTNTPSANFIPLSFITQQTDALEKEGLPYDYFTMTWSMSDNSVIDADLPEAVAAWNKEYAYPRLEIASASRIVSAYIEKFGNVIPERRGDLTEYWTDGLGSDALRTGYNRHSKERLIQAEILHSMIRGTKEANSFNEATSEAWRQVNLGSEHTWGYYKPEHPLAKQIEATKSSYFEAAKAQSEKILTDTLAAGSQPGAGAINVFNALSWNRTDVVELPAGVAGLQDASGTTVPVQKLSTGKTVFLATDVPSLGSKSWKTTAAGSAAPSAFKLTATTLENELVKVEINPATGDVAHLIEKRTGHDFVDPQSPYAVNSFRYLQGGNPASKALPPTNVRILPGDDGPVVASLKIESDAPGCNKLVREVRLTAGSARVDFLDTVDKVSTRYKEGIHFGFAFNVPDGRIRMDIPWGVMEPEKDQMPGSNKNWLAYQRWMDVSNGDRGITWSGIEAPIVEIGDITANLLGGVRGSEKWRKTIAPTQTFFSWALNNHWHTNFPLEQGGVIPFRYAVKPHGAFDPVESNRFGMEVHRPMLAVDAQFAQPSKAPVALDNSRIVVSTLKPLADGVSLLRLRSLSDKPEALQLSFPGGVPKELRICGGDDAPGALAPTTQTMLPYGCLSLWVKW